MECHAFSRYILKNYGQTIEVCNIKTLEDFKKEIAKCKMVISPRMHACIFGLIYNKEVVPICISKKIQAFFDEYMYSAHDMESFREGILNSLDSALF